MRLLAARRRARPQGRGQTQEFQHSVAAMETESVLRGWCRLPPTNWKKPSCAESAANWNRPAWPAPETRSRCNRWSADRRKLGGTILATAGQGRNLRSATVHEVEDRVSHPCRVL